MIAHSGVLSIRRISIRRIPIIGLGLWLGLGLGLGFGELKFGELKRNHDSWYLSHVAIGNTSLPARRQWLQSRCFQ